MKIFTPSKSTLLATVNTSNHNKLIYKSKRLFEEDIFVSEKEQPAHAVEENIIIRACYYVDGALNCMKEYNMFSLILW